MPSIQKTPAVSENTQQGATISAALPEDTLKLISGGVTASVTFEGHVSLTES